MHIEQLLTKEEEAKVVEAIQLWEKNTSGEIRVHLENHLKKDLMDRAAQVFDKLKMQDTAERNGVLLYFCVCDRKFAIIGDAGINARVAEGYWEKLRDDLVAEFAKKHFCEGIIAAIEVVGKTLENEFPFQVGDVNELPDDISYG